MESGETNYIWQLPNWPDWRYDLASLAEPLARVHHAQGHLLGRMAHIGLGLRDQATLKTMTEDVLKTSEIEGEKLNPDSVRSSIARRLGIDIGALAPVDHFVDGVVEMTLDAAEHYAVPLTADRLFGWHNALFPNKYSGLSSIVVGAWRTDVGGPMQVVSGPVGRQRVHYEAPPASRLETETARFFDWFNASGADDPVLKAGLAHLWLVTLHPFDDGNGRIARAVSDMALARAEQSTYRFYSLSAQIQFERKDYYDLLEQTQKGTMEVTDWLAWFLGCLLRAINRADVTLAGVLNKARFWQHWSGTPMNARQIMLLNRLLDGFDGKLTNRKWAIIAKCSSDTALRDINDLINHGALRKSESGGRSTSYELNIPSI